MRQYSVYAVISVSVQPAEQVSDKDELLARDTGLATLLKIRDRRKKNFRKTYDTGLVTFMM